MKKHLKNRNRFCIINIVKIWAFREHIMKELLVLEKKATTRKIDKKHSVLLILLILAFVGVIVAGCIMNYAHAANNNKEIAAISEKVEEAKTENEELERFLNDKNHDEYYEKIAREEYDYAKPGERVFYDSSFGNKK